MYVKGLGRGGEDADATLRYLVKAIINTADKKDKMEFTQDFMIRQPTEDAMPNEVVSQSKPLKCCGCFGFGSTKISAEFEKNVLNPNEIARAHVKIDNSKSKLDIKNISLIIE